MGGAPVAEVDDRPQLDVGPQRLFQLRPEIVRDAERVGLCQVRRVEHLTRVALDPVGWVSAEATVLAADREVLVGDGGEAAAVGLEHRDRLVDLALVVARWRLGRPEPRQRPPEHHFAPGGRRASEGWVQKRARRGQECGAHQIDVPAGARKKDARSRPRWWHTAVDSTVCMTASTSACRPAGALARGSTAAAACNARARAPRPAEGFSNLQTVLVSALFPM